MPSSRAAALVVAGFAAVALLVVACVGDDQDFDPGGDAGGQADTSPGVGDGVAPPDGGTSEGGPDATACTMCGGTCVDTTADPSNCGGCGKTCTSDAGVAFGCVASACGNSVVQVASGYGASCVVLLDRSLWCWGSTKRGELGSVDTLAHPAPTKIALPDVVEARIGNGFACARKTDGSVWCWGDNTFGVLGHAPGLDPACSGTCDPVPKAYPLPSGVKAAQLTAAFGNVCIRTEGPTGGDVYCWGHSFGGITGDPTAALGSYRPMPQKISVFTGDVTDVSLGSYDDGGPGHRPIACATRNDRTVWCWGVNHSGGLGHSGGTDVTCTANAPMPCNGTPIKVEGVSAVTGLSTGGTFACALTQTGAVHCWGNNSNGYLGTGNTTASAAPLQVPGLNTTNLVASANLGVFAIDSLGGVKGWGANGHGQLALGAYSGAACASFSCFTSAQSVTALQGAKQIALTMVNGLALKNDGSVVTWGSNGSGELGHAPFTNGDTTCGVGSGACNPTPAPLLDAPWRF